MYVCIYKARGKNGYIYDMSLNPLVDFEILKNTRNINNIEVITPPISIKDADEILKSIYETPSIISRIITSGDFYIKNKLKKLGLKRTSKIITSGCILPSKEEISKLEKYITGRVMTFKRLNEIKQNIGIKSNILDIIQVLYCERRIKVVPAVRNSRGKSICSFCDREKCESCNFGFIEDDIMLYAADNYNISIPNKVINKLSNTKDDIKNISLNINKFINSKKSSLIFWCVPHSFQYEALIPGIVNVINNGGRILYVTSSLSTYEVMETLKASISDVRIGNTNRYDINLTELDISVCSYNEYPCFHKAFDIVILDERDFFIQRPVNNINYICKRAVKERGKFISITCYSNNKKGLKAYSEVITVPVSNSRNPIPEPKVVVSRFLKNDEPFMPPMAVEIINWSISQGAKVIVFTPNEFYMRRVYYYLTDVEDIDKVNIDTSDADDKTSFIMFKKGNIDILISCDFKDALHIVKNTNVIVMYGDDKVYGVDTLINMSAMASFYSLTKPGEAVIVCANENDTISNAKSVIRSINKIAWEKNYVNI